MMMMMVMMMMMMMMMMMVMMMMMMKRIKLVGAEYEDVDVDDYYDEIKDEERQ